MNFVAVAVLVVCAPPDLNYYQHPGCCKIKPGVVCAGGTCLSCSQAPFPGWGSAPYNYRIAFDYPWVQTHWLPPVLTPRHDFAIPLQPEEIQGIPDELHAHESKGARRASRPPLPASANTRIAAGVSRSTSYRGANLRRRMN